MAKTEVHILEVGDLVSEKYRLVEEVGRGAMGVVYRATQEGMDREVAVKTLLPQAVAHPRMVARFKQEVRVISQLKHPNTITIFDYGELPGGQLFFVMEMLEGVSLGQILKEEGSLAPARVRRISMQILKSLDEAHSCAVVHRDLKPDNIFICDVHGESDYVKVLDFGIAKALAPATEEELQELTGTGMSVGTPVYMAPEQIERRTIGPQTDVYGLGCLMYEMLTGRPLFVGTSWIEVAMKKLGETPVLLRSDVVHSALGGVLLKALRREVPDRYESAKAMLSDLASVGALDGTPALTPSRPGKLKSGTPIDALVVDTPDGPRVVTSPGYRIDDAGLAAEAPSGELTRVDARTFLEDGVLEDEVGDVEESVTRVEPSLFETDAPVYGHDSQSAAGVIVSDSVDVVSESVGATARVERAVEALAMKEEATRVQTPPVGTAAPEAANDDVTRVQMPRANLDSGLRPSMVRSRDLDDDGTTQVRAPAESSPSREGRLNRPAVRGAREGGDETDDSRPITAEVGEASRRAVADADLALEARQARQIDKRADGVNVRVLILAMSVIVLFMLATAAILMVVLALQM